MFKKLLNFLFKKGFKIGYSTGRPFDPRDAKGIHSDPIKDMIKRERGKHGKSGNKTKKKT